MPRGYCYTLNNWTELEYETLKSIGKMKYHIIGKEIAPTTGTPHLQGFILFLNDTTFSSVKKKLGKRVSNIQPIKGSPFQNYTYCSKGTDFIEIGIRPLGNGNRTDLDTLKEQVNVCYIEKLSVSEICDNLATSYNQIKYIESIIFHKNKLKMEKEYKLFISLNTDVFCSYQQRWHDLLIAQNDYAILFIVDTIHGHIGKSRFTTIMEKKYGSDILAMTSDKLENLNLIFQCQKYLIYDTTKKGTIDYDFLESLKNGRLSCGKYVSHLKNWPGSKVIVLMNKEPDYSSLMRKRYEVFNMDEYFIDFPEENIYNTEEDIFILKKKLW